MFSLNANGQPSDALTSLPGMTFSDFYLYWNYTMGWKFQMNSDEAVTSLGIYDPNGLTSDHPVGIWNISGTLLGSTTISAGATASADGFAWATCPSIDLSAGQTYYIGAYYGENTTDAVGVQGKSKPTTSSAVTYEGYTFVESSVANLVFPRTTGSINEYFGPNFQYEAMPVPEEPCAAALASLSAASLWLFRCRK